MKVCDGTHHFCGEAGGTCAICGGSEPPNETSALIDKLRGALADIANSSDMTLEIARRKAARIYAETGPTE